MHITVHKRPMHAYYSWVKGDGVNVCVCVCCLPELRSALTEWLAATDVRLLQGFIRPGCVHLSLDCMKVAPSCGAASSAYTGTHNTHTHTQTHTAKYPSTHLHAHALTQAALMHAL